MIVYYVGEYYIDYYLKIYKNEKATYVCGLLMIKMIKKEGDK